MSKGCPQKVFKPMPNEETGQQIKQPTPKPTKPGNAQEVGFTLSVRDFLVQTDGLPSVKLNDLVVSEGGARGWVNSLYQDKTQILMLDEANVEPGTMFKRMGAQLAITPGEFMIGRAINPLGIPIDGHGPLSKGKTAGQPFEMDKEAPGIDKRQFITEQFDTGISLIDTLIPLGRGQRELILGDARSGKTRFLVDVVTNQKITGVICIYTLIGKPTTNVRNLIDILNTTKALDHTVIIAASSTDVAPLAFLAPHAALSVAEYFQKQGRDVLVILDDLGNHAKTYREISLLSDKAPGRESYPGDIFYQHSHLLERGGKFTKENGSGSITLLPVIELNLNDFTTFIPTNLMSMTDGHLLFKADLYNQGHHPAIDISLSVSRVGRQTQNRVQNSLAYKLKQVLTRADELETLSRFSAELPAETQLILKQKDMINEIINQPPLSFIPKETQISFLALVFTNFLKYKNLEFLKIKKEKILSSLSSDPQINQITKEAFKFKTEDELIAKLETVGPRLEELCRA